MRTVPLSEFRLKCSTLLKHVNTTHETIQITRFGLPLAEIKPPGLSPEERAARDAREIEILDRYADELNANALEGLDDQAPVDSGKKKQATKKKSRRR